jgi:ABC-type uncharacterized transport system permease subunit
MYPNKLLNAIVSILSIFLGLLFTFPLFRAANVDPFAALELVLGVFTTTDGVTASIIRSIPLLLIAVGLCIPFKMGFWNIGAEGQLLMGASAATWVVLILPSSPAVLMIPLMMLLAFLGGGIWGVIPGTLKAKLGVNEILTTLMMNFIATFWIAFLVYGPWRDPQGHGFPLTPMFPSSAILPLVPGTAIHSGILMAVVCAMIVYFLLNFTRLGYEIKVVGESPRAAKYAGISYLSLTMISMLLSGGFSGLAGMALVSGVVGRLRPGISPGYGYTAIIVAFLGRLNPLFALVAGLLFGGLLVSGDALQIGLGLAYSTVQVFQGLILLFVVGADVVTRYKITVSLS